MGTPAATGADPAPARDGAPLPVVLPRGRLGLRGAAVRLRQPRPRLRAAARLRVSLGGRGQGEVLDGGERGRRMGRSHRTAFR